MAVTIGFFEVPVVLSVLHYAIFFSFQRVPVRNELNSQKTDPHPLSFVHSFVLPLVHSFVRSFIRKFISSFVRSFVRWSIYLASGALSNQQRIRMGVGIGASQLIFCNIMSMESRENTYHANASFHSFGSQSVVIILSANRQLEIQRSPKSQKHRLLLIHVDALILLAQPA